MLLCMHQYDFIPISALKTGNDCPKILNYRRIKYTKMILNNAKKYTFARNENIKMVRVKLY